VPEVAELLGISRTTAYECVRRGEIPAITLGRRVLVARAALDRLVDVHASAPTAQERDRPSGG
jgi:excisionase family DNA binding protein